MKRLTEIHSSSVCTVKWMLGLPDETDRELRNCEIQQGSRIRVIQNNGHWLIIGAGSRRIAMDEKIAGHICV